MKNWLITLSLLLLFVVALMAEQLSKAKEENQRLEANQAALIEQSEEYLSESNRNAISCAQLTLTNEELKKNYQDMCAKAKDLQLEVKRLQSVSEAGTRTEILIQTAVRDSIIYRDRIDTVKVITWKDPWINLDGVIDHDTANINVVSADTITQFIHKVPKRFLFFRFGCKAIRQEMVSSNPHTRLEYLQYIELK